MTPTMWQTALEQCAEFRRRHGRAISISLGFISEDEMRAIVEESGITTQVQPSGQLIGCVIEVLGHVSATGDSISAYCTRPARPGDEQRVPR